MAAVVFRHPDLTLAERMTLLALETFADFPDGTNARPGVAKLAEMCRLGERVVEEALHKARRLKLIEQTARANPKRKQAATYRLLPLHVSTRTGARAETDFNPHENGFNPHGDVVSTRTPVQPTNRDNQYKNTKKETRAPARTQPGSINSLSSADRKALGWQTIGKERTSPAPSSAADDDDVIDAEVIDIFGRDR